MELLITIHLRTMRKICQGCVKGLYLICPMPRNEMPQQAVELNGLCLPTTTLPENFFSFSFSFILDTLEFCIIFLLKDGCLVFVVFTSVVGKKM